MDRRFVKCTLKVLSMLISLFLAGSISYSATTSPEPTSESLKVIRIGSSPAGALGYIWATATGKLISVHTSMSVKIEPYTSTSVFRNLINKGDLHLGYNSPPDLHGAYRGIEGSVPAPRIRMILSGPHLFAGQIVRADSGMKHIKDVKGKKVAGGYKGHRLGYIRAAGALANAGLTWDDVIVVPVVNPKASVVALQEGRVVMAGHAVGASDVEKANAAIPGGVRFLNLDPSPEAVARMQKFIPGGEVVQVTSGTGILGPTYVQSWKMALITSEDVSGEVIYQVTKAIWEHAQDLYPFHKSMTTMTPDNLLFSPASSVIPYHPGAVRLYKEKGVWTSEHDGIQSRLLKEAAK